MKIIFSHQQAPSVRWWWKFVNFSCWLLFGFIRHSNRVRRRRCLMTCARTSLPPLTFSDFQTFSDYLSSPFVMYNIMVRLLVHPSTVGVRDRRFSPEAVVVIVPLSTTASSPVLNSLVSCAPTTALSLRDAFGG